MRGNCLNFAKNKHGKQQAQAVGLKMSISFVFITAINKDYFFCGLLLKLNVFGLFAFNVWARQGYWNTITYNLRRSH